MVGVESKINESVVVAEQSDSFLRGLVYDDELRADLAADPAGTLARFGIQVDPATMPATVRLPSPDALRRSLDLKEDESLWDRVMQWFPFMPENDD